jgi:cellulose biosynthesis protein BcsQ
MILTFYSYKGGVGRSMAMANLARWFNLCGARVLLVDWDLEAPGIENFFFDSADTLQRVQSQLGLMDMLGAYKSEFPLLLSQFKKAPQSPASGSFVSFLQANLRPLDQYLINVTTLEKREERSDSVLYLVPAGLRSREQFSNYAAAVQSFDWTEFYARFEGEAFFEWLRLELAKRADIVLIDSRTGVTEMGGVCTRQLADVVVAFCAPNSQNLAGVMDMVRSFVHSDLREARQKNSRSLPGIVIVPTRIENGEDDLRTKFKNEFLSKIGDLRDLQLDAEGLWQLRIPYIPKYSYAERLAVGQSDGSEDLISAYEKLGAHLVNVALKDTAWTAQLNTAVRSALIRTVEKQQTGQLAVKVHFLFASQDHDYATTLVRRFRDDGFQLRTPAEQRDAPPESSVTAQSDVVVVLVSEASMVSKWLLEDLTGARRLGVPIIPISTSSSFPRMPSWLFRLHITVAPELNWTSFASAVRSFPKVLRVPSPPPLPAGVLLRQALIDEVAGHLIKTSAGAKANVAALAGMAGNGKSTFALTVCHDSRIVDRFVDGVLWIKANDGSTLLRNIVSAIGSLTGAEPNATTLRDAVAYLQQLTRNLEVLIVVDDVNDAASANDAQMFFLRRYWPRMPGIDTQPKPDSAWSASCPYRVS